MPISARCRLIASALTHGMTSAAPGCSGRADRPEQPGGVVAVITHPGRTRAPLGPDMGQRALLADPGLVLKPDLDLFVGRVRRQCRRYMLGEVFSNASCAARSRLG